MDENTYNEICKTLYIANRLELVAEMEELKTKIVDKSYDPKEDIRKSKLKKNHEPYSDDEGSAEEEHIKVKVDEEGFYSIDSDD